MAELRWKHGGTTLFAWWYAAGSLCQEHDCCVLWSQTLPHWLESPVSPHGQGLWDSFCPDNLTLSGKELYLKDDPSLITQSTLVHFDLPTTLMFWQIYSHFGVTFFFFFFFFFFWWPLKLVWRTVITQEGYSVLCRPGRGFISDKEIKIWSIISSIFCCGVY